MTNHKKLIWRHCVTGPELSFLRKRKGLLKIDQSVKMPWHRLSMGVACSFSSTPGDNEHTDFRHIHAVSGARLRCPISLLFVLFCFFFFFFCFGDLIHLKPSWDSIAILVTFYWKQQIWAGSLEISFHDHPFLLSKSVLGLHYPIVLLQQEFVRRTSALRFLVLILAWEKVFSLQWTLFQVRLAVISKTVLSL